MADNDPQLGAWGDERASLEKTPISSRGSDADVPDRVRFGRSITRVVARRERDPEAEFDRPAAFVMVTGEQFELLPAGTSRLPLLHTGHYKVTGRIHFVNPSGTGRYLDYDGDSGELFATLESLGMQALPTLVYSPKKGSSTLSWYPKGIGDEDVAEILDIVEHQPNVDSISAVISRVHEGELITPDQTPKNASPWLKPDLGWAHEDAEARVQYAVKLALLGAFRHCSVRAEQSGKDGRTDLEIVTDQDRSPDQIEHHAILEMKVLREKGSTGKKYTDKATADHMREGMAQAHTYGDRRNFRDRMLCCFDMRANNTGADAVLAPLKADADTLGVHLRHWFLYRSSAHWRACSVAQALKNAKTPPGPR